MPRNHLSGASTLRNRNRVTNKTRLKIHHGNLDADALLIPDEDEEKHRLTNLVAGVDAEDANEHHLQEVLSAAHRSSAAISRITKGIQEKPGAPAYIPTPDSTGIVDNYEEFYPLNRWKDPATYVCTSLSTEECTTDGLTGGYTYYMDERDKEWLDKNNEEARGEGTSVQGAVSTSGTRTSARSAKAKGKEPDVSQPVVISEDEFELVVGIYEKLTSEKYEYLHHGLDTGMFPAFTDYQDTFSHDLPAQLFSSFTVPSWVPKPPQLLRIARTIYPYWKERRLEREGHRIIPALNGDESDTLNESYICFRRREIKAVRKTRASQVTSSDKLARLQAELSYPLELAKLILDRENFKKDCAQQAEGVWQKRQALVDLKRMHPAAFSEKADEELLVDKERPAKKSEPAARIPGLRIRTQDSAVSTPRQETSMHPKDRVNSIREKVEAILARQKEQDHHWEDQADNAYQQQPVPYASRLFKCIPPPEATLWPPSEEDVEDDPPAKPLRLFRLRIGRGGRRMLDRRDSLSRFTQPSPKRPKLEAPADDLNAMDVEDDDDESEDFERWRRLEERWKYDRDDMPAVGPEGQDEQDRVLVDEYQTKYLRHTMTILGDSDHVASVTDNALPVVTHDGRQLMFVPFRLGVPPSIHRRDASGNFRPIYPALAHFLSQPNTPQPPAPGVNGTPVAIQQQVKKMPPPTAIPQMRISSNGGMRPPAAATNGIQPSVSTHNSPPQPVPVPQHALPNGINGVASRPAIAMPHIDLVKTETHQPSALANGAISIQQTDSTQGTESAPTNSSPVRPKSQAQAPTLPPNGFHVQGNFSATTLAPTTYAQLAGNSALQNLKSTFASLPQGDFANLQSQLQRMPYMSALQLNAKAVAARQMQWASSPLQRPTSTATGLDGVNGVNGVGVQSSPAANHVSVTAPTTNGSRPAMRIPSNGQLSMSPMPQHTPSPLPHISQSQSPPRLPMTPTMAMASPSIQQQQQAVGSSQIGY